MHYRTTKVHLVISFYIKETVGLHWQASKTQIFMNFTLITQQIVLPLIMVVQRHQPKKLKSRRYCQFYPLSSQKNIVKSSCFSDSASKMCIAKLSTEKGKNSYKCFPLNPLQEIWLPIPETRRFSLYPGELA